MAKKHKHEEHLNAEAWAIPYGDLVTLLLALFVVMYAMSSVNEGKYRVLSESLNEAFHGTPKSSRPIQIGDQPTRGVGGSPMSPPPRPRQEPAGTGTPESLRRRMGGVVSPIGAALPVSADAAAGAVQAGERDALRRIAREVEQALGDLIRDQVVTVQRKHNQLEIEIKTDILFASGVAAIAGPARPVLTELGTILAAFPNPIRVEGYTDDMPIATAVFPSNWELSAARATSVVHVLIGAGLAPQRLSVTGYGEFRPVVPNDSADHRNRNRRVVLVVMASDEPAEPPPTSAGADTDTQAAPATQAMLAPPTGAALGAVAVAAP